MYEPILFDEMLFDDLTRRTHRERNETALTMHTDVEEQGGNYVMKMDLPGFKKENVSVELKKGTLTVRAAADVSDDKKDDSGRLIRSERFRGNCMRSFYVGENVQQEDVKAKFENGVLTLTFPKEEQRAKVEDSHRIAIQG